ncbi:MAG: ABC transporter ATP-binding protein [Alphaproteobacteria bacterium]|nr:ABC transporter ATP-binding protein [Alphaproteobacteria bacterium]
MITPANEIVTAQGVTLKFGGVVALDSVTISVNKGEIFGLVGPNGAGKTTLLNAISGVFPLSAGSVCFEGRDVTAVPLHRRVALGIGRTFQGVELFQDLTVQDNMMVGRHHLMKTGVLTGGLFWGWARSEEIAHRRRVEEFIEFFELERYRKRPVGALGYGIQKIVGLARAMCSEPRLLLLDEVASGLNRAEKENLARFMLRLKHSYDMTMIWVEHDVRMVAELTDRVAVLDYGKLVEAGESDKVLRDPRVREVFLGPAVKDVVAAAR